MTLRKITLFVICVASVFVLITAFVINQYFLVNTYERIEADQIKKDTLRAESVLNYFAEVLGQSSIDWANWDESYRFVVDLFPEYIEGNLVPGTFKALHLDAILFLNTSGDVVYSQGYRPETDSLLPVSSTLTDYVKASNLMNNPFANGSDHGVTGVIALPDLLAIAAAFSILPSSGVGEPRGSLVMIRYLEDEELELISDLAVLPVEIKGVSQVGFPQDFQQALTGIKETPGVWVNSSDSETVYGYLPIDDINGQTVAILRGESPRTFYQEGQKNHLVRMIFAGLAVLLWAFGALYVLNSRILNPVVKLSMELHKISTDGDYTARVKTRGKDEISTLAADINLVLAKIQEHREKDEKLRLQLESDLKQRAEFTRQLVHELKSPITPILSSSELLVEGLKEDPWAKLAANVYHGALDMNDRLDDLVDLARGEMGTLQLRFETLDMNNIAREMADEMSPLINSRKQTLDVKLPVALPAFRGDETRIRQVLRNLLSNATKFTPEKGRITIQVVQISGNIVVKVTDTGRGIAPDKLSVIFDEKEKIIEPGDRHSGLGLGLRLAKTLVELHGGTISAESELNKGTTFSFSIPVANNNSGA